MMRLPTLAILLPLLLSACSDAATPNDSQLSNTQKSVEEKTVENKQISSPKAMRENIQQKHKQLKSLVANTQCDNSSQCRVQAVGSRACGGPSSYIVYSNKGVDEQHVQKLVADITQQETLFNSSTGMASICQHLSAPSTQCIENKCVKVTSSANSVF